MFYRDLMRDGALMDLTGNEFLDRIEEGAREVAKYDGKDYALSMTMSAFGILVNNDLFEANGIAKPTTWAELIETAKAFEEKGIQPFALYGMSTEQLAQLAERLVGVIGNDITTTIATGWRVVFPLMQPIAATVAIQNALWIWNDFQPPL